MVRVLLERYADANTRDNNKWTPFPGASQRGNWDIKVLIKNSAHANSRDNSKQTL